jgi:hypothetical protein
MNEIVAAMLAKEAKKERSKDAAPNVDGEEDEDDGEEDGIDEDEGTIGLASLKGLHRKWELFTLVGGERQLRRKKGPYPQSMFTLVGEYPRVVCLDEAFDVIWKV